MKLREALFFSSKDAAYHDNSENDKHYRILVKEEQEEYKPFFLIGPNPPGTYLRPIYNVSVSTIIDSTIPDPHGAYKLYSIERAEDLLREWCIDIEQGWIPGEDTEDNA